MLANKLGFIGAGRMATALARGFVQAELLSPTSILASDPFDAAREKFAGAIAGATVYDQNTPVVATVDVLILAVKPQLMSHVLDEIRSKIGKEVLVVSIAAGVPLARLAAGLPANQRIVRVMPNTPCLVGRGASAFSRGAFATEADGELVAQLLSAVGIAREVPESQLDAVTGLSGSGPAFVYTMIEALTEGGAAVGLPPALAAELAAQTAAGAAEMIVKTGASPAALREQVTSPGGTTLAGLKALDENGFQGAVVAAIRAATQRSAELGQQAP
jgi:pyrroline-5-carboxylate reductase